MRKLFLPFVALAAMTLASCESTVKATDTKANLEKAGYTASIVDAAYVKNAFPSLKTEGYKITDFLYAGKGFTAQPDIFFAVYFESIDEASRFLSDNNNENLGFFIDIAKAVSEEPKVGSHNNVAYAGTPTSLDASGLLK